MLLHILDPKWIEQTHALHLGLIKTNPENGRVVLAPNNLWERGVNLYGSVIKKNSKTLGMWYQVINRDRANPPKFRTAVGYAESSDGLSFRRVLKGHIHDDYGKTNLVMLSSGRAELCAPSVVRKKDGTYYAVFFDGPEIIPSQTDKFKWKISREVSGWRPILGEGIYCARSQDGIRWKKNPYPIVQGTCDAGSLAVLPDGRFLLTYKLSVHKKRHFRELAYSVSNDEGKTWSSPRLILRPDARDDHGTEYYGMSVYALDNVAFGLIWLYHNNPANKKIDCHLAFCPDLTKLDKWLKPDLRDSVVTVGSEGSWCGARVYAGSYLPSDAPFEQGTLYFGAGTTNHDDFRYWSLNIGRVDFNPVFSYGLEARYFDGILRSKKIKLTKSFSVLSSVLPAVTIIIDGMEISCSTTVSSTSMNVYKIECNSLSVDSVGQIQISIRDGFFFGLLFH